MTIDAGDQSLQPTRRRVLGTRDLVLFTVSSVLIVDQLPATASIGPSALGWWAVMMLFFVVPYAMIAAELGSAWPSQGGAYVWIRRAFGQRWAARSAFYYWIQLSIWLPSAAILAVSMTGQLFGTVPNAATTTGLAVVVLWLNMALASLRTEVGRWIPNAGAAIKIGVLLCVGVMGGLAVMANPPANPLSLAAVAPSYTAALQFLPILVFSLFGFELIASAGDEIKDPGRQLPRAMILSGLIVGALYVFATFGMLAVLPADGIVLDRGLVDVLRFGFGDSRAGLTAVGILGSAIIFTLLTTMVTWTMGLNRLVQEAAQSGDMPQLFALRHPRHSAPIGANIASGVVGTLVLMALPSSSTVEELFWSMVSLCSVVFLVPYSMIFLAFLRLRALEPDRLRPFSVPGGAAGAWVAAGLSLFFVVQAIVLFIHVPGTPVNWAHSGPVLAGFVAVLLAGELVLRATRAYQGPPT